MRARCGCARACTLASPAAGAPPLTLPRVHFCTPVNRYAAKDSERKAAIEAKNEADSLIYSGAWQQHGLRFSLIHLSCTSVLYICLDHRKLIGSWSRQIQVGVLSVDGACLQACVHAGAAHQWLTWAHRCSLGLRPCCAAEKSVSEYKDRLPQNVVDSINAAIADVRGVLESENSEVRRRRCTHSAACACVGVVQQKERHELLQQQVLPPVFVCQPLQRSCSSDVTAMAWCMVHGARQHAGRGALAAHTHAAG